MPQYVAIDSIRTNRTLVPGDDLTELAKDIQESGLRVPVLLDHGNQVIDGLRRIEAVRSLGNDTIEVAQITLYPQVCAWLKRAREDGHLAAPLTPRRVWQIYSATRPLMNITRSHMQRGRGRGLGVRIGGRELIVEALGVDSVSWLQALTQVYRASEEDPTERGDLAREAVEMLDRGETTVYMAVEHMRNPPGLHGDLRSAAEQRAAFSGAVSSLNGIGRGLSQLGPIHKDLKGAEIEGYLKDLRKFRAMYTRLIRTIEEEIKPSE